MLSDVFLEELRTACPIETVMGSYVNLIRRGRTYVCSCPFHSEKLRPALFTLNSKASIVTAVVQAVTPYPLLEG